MCILLPVGMVYGHAEKERVIDGSDRLVMSQRPGLQDIDGLGWLLPHHEFA